MDFLEKDDVIVITKNNKSSEGVVVEVINNYKAKAMFGGIENIIDTDDITEVNGFKREKPVYYQPRWTDEDMDNDDLNSWNVYREFENAKLAYPDHVIDRYEGSDIEEHTFLDDEEDATPTYYVDIPDSCLEGGTVNLFCTRHKPDALLYVRLFFGADENGNINLISKA